MNFPDPCGDFFERAVQQGADPDQVVPDGYYVIRGGAADFDPNGGTYSCTVGPTPEAAAAALPHGKIRITTVEKIRVFGGIVRWTPEVSRYGTINKQHVDVILSGLHPFETLQSNPVPKEQRIDGII
jgi:hypothetical protein